MSHLLTAAAINQSGVNLAIAGDLSMQSGNFIGIDGTGGYISFDSSSNFVGIGPGSGTDSTIKFTSSVSSKIIDSNGSELLEFAAATGSAIDYLKLTPGTASTNTSLAAVSSATNASVEISPKGTGQLVLQTPSNASTGIAFSAGSSGSNFYSLLGPQSGLQANDASLTFPDIVTASQPSSGDVMKVAASSSTDAIVLEFAADTSGGLTYNDIASASYSGSTLAAANIYAVNDLTATIAATTPTAAASADGDTIEVIDSNGTASATVLITITAGVGSTINGNASLSIDGAYQAVTLKFNSTTAKWNIA